MFLIILISSTQITLKIYVIIYKCGKFMILFIMDRRSNKKVDCQWSILRNIFIAKSSQGNLLKFLRPLPYCKRNNVVSLLLSQTTPSSAAMVPVGYHSIKQLTPKQPSHQAWRTACFLLDDVHICMKGSLYHGSLKDDTLMIIHEWGSLHVKVAQIYS